MKIRVKHRDTEVIVEEEKAVSSIDYSLKNLKDLLAHIFEQIKAAEKHE